MPSPLPLSTVSPSLPPSPSFLWLYIFTTAFSFFSKAERPWGRNIMKDGNSTFPFSRSIFPLHIQKQELTQTGTSRIGGLVYFWPTWRKTWVATLKTIKATASPLWCTVNVCWLTDWLPNLYRGTPWEKGSLMNLKQVPKNIQPKP